MVDVAVDVGLGAPTESAVIAVCRVTGALLGEEKLVGTEADHLCGAPDSTEVERHVEPAG